MKKGRTYARPLWCDCIWCLTIPKWSGCLMIYCQRENTHISNPLSTSIEVAEEQVDLMVRPCSTRPSQVGGREHTKCVVSTKYSNSANPTENSTKSIISGRGGRKNEGHWKRWRFKLRKPFSLIPAGEPRARWGGGVNCPKGNAESEFLWCRHH